MTVQLGFIGATAVLSATDTPPSEEDRFTPNAPETARRKYVLTASADCHIAVNEDATASSAYLVAKLPYEIEMFGTDELSFITDSAATIYLTQVD